MLYYSV